jgi:hypothetical protein
MVGTNLAKGIQEAYGFQRRLWQAGHPGQPMPKKPAASVTRGLSQLYQGVVFDGKGMKALLLSSLLKPFDDAACVISDHGARSSDLSQLAFLVHVAAELGYKRMDEPLSIIHSLDDILQKRSVPVISSFQAALKVSCAVHFGPGLSGALPAACSCLLRWYVGISHARACMNSAWGLGVGCCAMAASHAGPSL